MQSELIKNEMVKKVFEDEDFKIYERSENRPIEIAKFLVIDRRESDDFEEIDVAVETLDQVKMFLDKMVR